MAQLTRDMHPALNEYVIRLLNKNGIHTLAEFIQTDDTKLGKLINITDLREISSIKNDLAGVLGVMPIDGLTYHKKLTTNRPAHLPTNIRQLDELLSDGLMMGNLIDICGSPDAGKTQLCTSIAINLAQFSQVETLWIDTKADFSARRIQKILKNRNCRETEIREIMQRIRIDTCNDPHKLIQMIEQLIENFEAYQSARLLVIDSLPALWFLFHGEDRHVGSTAIAKLANNLRKLAVECGMVILTVNIATRYSPIDSGINNKSKLDDSNVDDTAAMDANITPDTLVPALGKFWQSICSTRLLITRPGPDATGLSSVTTSGNWIGASNSSDPSQRTIRIMKCNQLRTGDQCSVNISDIGIR